MLSGWTTQGLQRRLGWSAVRSYRTVFWAYAVVGLVKLGLSLILTEASEQGKQQPKAKPTASRETRPLLADQQEESLVVPAPVESSPAKKSSTSLISVLKSLLPSLSSESLSVVTKLCFLFAIDSIASGLTPASLITYWLYHKFLLAEGTLGTIFLFLNILSSASNLLASSIARRIGLIKTMVLTHIPASLALTLFPFPNNVVVVIALMVIRASTNSMDQAPRQAFLAAAVLPGERTAVMGTVNVVKTLSQSVGPVVTGTLSGRGKFWIAFVMAGSLKIAYDVLMLGMFLGYRTQEERAEQMIGDGQAESEEGREETANVNR